MAITTVNSYLTASGLNFREGTTGKASLLLDPSSDKINLSGNFNLGTGSFTIGGNAIVTGASAIDSDTLQTVTDRGNTTTTSVFVEGQYLSGVSGLFSDKVNIGTPVGTHSCALEVAGIGSQIIVADTASVAAGVGGAIDFFGVYGAAGQRTSFGRVEAKKTDAIGNNYGAGLALSTRVHGGGSLTERITILESGNVGIGTTAPTNNLHIVGTMQLDNSVSDAFKIRLNGNQGLAYDHDSISSTNAGYDITIQAGKELIFKTYDGGFNEAMRIDTDGNVGIGIDSPIYGLDVHNTGIRLGGAANAWVFNNDWEGLIEFAGSDFLGVQAGAAGSVYLKGGRALYLGSSKLDIGNMLTMVPNYVGGNSVDLYCYGQLEWDLHSYYNEKFIINYNSGTHSSPVYSPAFVVAGRNESGYIGLGTSSPAYRLDVYGDVGGTGVGDRITLNGTGYLLSGDSPAETQTLQQVCDNGAATDTAMGITGALTLANHIYKNVENSYLGIYGGTADLTNDGFIRLY